MVVTCYPVNGDERYRAGQTMTLNLDGTAFRRGMAALAGAALLAATAGPVRASEPIRPIPREVAVPEAKAELGRKLFRDPRLSSDGTVSCATCHPLARGGADNRPVSRGVKGRKGPVNAPTVYNSRFNVAQFWNGRAATLAEQVDGPLHDRNEMNATWDEVLPRLRKDDAYREAFGEVFPERGITDETVAGAIAAFERTLITPDSPVDQYLRGDEDALTEKEKAGYRLFKDYGCASCHQGAAVGGNMFQTFGAMGDYFEARGGKVTAADLGRYTVTDDPADRHVFKVPSLRLAALTPPYFHDASAGTLAEAVRVMGRFQLGREIPPKDVKRIVAFLEALVGKHPLLNAAPGERESARK